MTSFLPQRALCRAGASSYKFLTYYPGAPRRTTYVDAVYCYRPSSMVCRSVCRSVTLVSPANRLNRWRCRLGLGLGWAPKEPCISWGAHWRHLTNMRRRCDLLSNYFHHLLLSLYTSGSLTQWLKYKFGAQEL